MRKLVFVMPCLLAAAAWAQTEVYRPDATSYVRSSEASVPHSSLIACNEREGLVRLDVNGMENVTNAVLRLYVTQHNDADYKPIVFRQMMDVDWLESRATLNELKHEFPVFPSAWISKDDPLCIGSCGRVPGLNQWMEVDITAAVKREAKRTGKLAFIVSALGWRGVNNLPTCFAGLNNTDPELQPQFVVSWADGDSRGTETRWVKCPCTDDFTTESGGATIRKDDAFLAGGNREAFFKFDLSGLVGRGRIRRATVKFSARTSSNPAAAAGYLKPFDNIDWTDEDYPAGALKKTLPHGLAFGKDSTDGAYGFVNSWHASCVNEMDVTKLVTATLAAGRDKVSFHLWVNSNGYCIGSSHRSTVFEGPVIQVDLERADAPLVTKDGEAVKVAWTAVEGATGYAVERATDPEGEYVAVAETAATEAHDLFLPGAGQYWYRVVAKTAAGEAVSPPAYHQEISELDSRLLIHYARINNWSNKNSSGNSSNETETACQTGSSNAGDGSARVLDTFMLFDPSGLENAPFVRLRLKIQKTSNTMHNERRFFGAVTPYWDCTKVAWSNLMPEFDNAVVERLGDGSLPNELARIWHYIGLGTDNVSQPSPYMDIDVTELAHRAAREGRYVTILLAAPNNHGWTWYCTERDKANGARLVYPRTQGFATVFKGETDLSGERPATALSWTPCPDATAYRVDRYDAKRREWRTIVEETAEPTAVDPLARPDRAYLYRVTATRADGGTATAEMTHRLDAATVVPNVCDGFLFNSGDSPANWTARSIVMKDGGETYGGGTREGIVRFDLAQVPADVRRVLFRLHIGDLGSYTYDECLCFRTVPDRDISDANPPTWKEILGSQIGSTKETADGVFYIRDLAKDKEPFVPFGDVEADVTAPVREALANGESHVIFHVFSKDPDLHNLNFGFATKESPYVTSAPRLVCEPKSWLHDGITVIVR